MSGFEKRESGTSIVYAIQSELSLPLIQLIAEDVIKDLTRAEDVSAIILDLGNFDLDPKTFKVLSPLGLELLKKNRRIHILTEKNSIHFLVKQEGMERLAKPIRSLSEIPSRISDSKKKPAPKIDVTFLNPFIEGMIQVLKVQCKTTATPMKPMLKTGSALPCSVDIAGVIGLTSPAFKGNIAICFPLKVFMLLMGRMLGEEFTEFNDELKDGAAEIANMILGHAKTVLNERGHAIEKALPSVISGPNLKIDHGGSQDSIVLPFAIEEFIFFMEVATEQN